MNQTVGRENLEIILVDDCSTDESWEVIKEYEKKYPDIVKALRTPQNLKQGGARNLGLKEACGEWIGFMDGDDWPARDMYEKLLEKASETGADVVGCDLHQVHEHTMEIGSIVNANTMDQTGVLDIEKKKKLVLNPCSMVIKIYKSKLIRDNNLSFPENMFYEDNAEAPVWMLCSSHFEKVEEPLYYYYQESGSTTHHISVSKCEDRLEAGRILLREFKQRGWFDSYKEELEAAFTKLYYSNTLFTYMSGVDKTSMGFVRKMMRELKANFPEFEKNPYFDKLYDAEEKKLMLMHKKSTLLFYTYYKLLWFYRRVRYNKD